VAFNSGASNLVATADTNAEDDVFVRDLVAGTTTLVSRNGSGTNSGNGTSGYPQISANNAVVVFGSNASDLVANDTNGTFDVFTLPILSNLTVTDVHLADKNGDRLDSAAIGQMAYLKVKFNTAALPSAAKYLVRGYLDGIPLEQMLTLGAGQSETVSHSVLLGPWLVLPGSHQVHAVVDAGNAIDEWDEADNLKSDSFDPITFAPKLITPLGGTPYEDWTIVNYVDLDKGSPGVLDYRGGNYTYDGHDAIDGSRS
jgi:hypothetical protein